MIQRMAKRIKALREERGLSQDDLARIFGFRDRQTVSAIETGVRRLSADELVLAVEKLDVSLDYFTDPFLLAGEGRFSWRLDGADDAVLDAYERKAGPWIAAYRTLAPQVGRGPPLLRRTLALESGARFEDAAHAGERFADEFGLGDAPAARLAGVMERDFDILVLMVDAEPGISGAACRLPDLDAVLIARHELPGRRHFDLAHELFHILTWDTMPPARWETDGEAGGKKIERLANRFAAALLMPAPALERFGRWSHLAEDHLIARLNAVATELQVSSSALRWRLVELGEVDDATARGLPEAALHRNGGAVAENCPPVLFSRPFAEVLGLALVQGHLSVRRAASLLGLTIDGLADLFAAHGVARPSSLRAE
ncbi:MAG: XRE family transcriptional regulator [bacterium]|nr:XRE family transcriptional regulator [bacterium]